MPLYYGNMKQVAMPRPPADELYIELSGDTPAVVESFRSHKTGEKPRQDTRVFISRDADGLSARFECDDRDIVAEPREDNDIKLWKDDSVYLWLDPGHKHDASGVIMFHVSVAGALCIQRDSAAGSVDGVVRESFRTEHGWHCRLTVPWRFFDMATPEPGDVWGVCLARMDQPGVYDYDQMEMSSTASACFDEVSAVDGFGHLFFSQPPDDAAAALRKMAQQHEKRIDILGKAYYREMARAQRLDEELDACKGVPANPKASEDARKVLAYLTGLPDRAGKRFLLAQDIWSYQGGLDDGYERFVARLAEQTGKWLPMLHVSYPDSSVDSDKAVTICADANRHAIAYWKAGGLITIHTNPANPWTGGGSCDLTQRENLSKVTEPGTPENLAWRRTLDALSGHLAELREAGVVVLWRPLHEMTFNNCYWYDCGATSDREVFKNLWRDMFHYMTEEKGLDNLLWVYSTSDVGSWNGPAPDSVYPGGDFVDVVGISLYGNSVTVDGGAYEILTALGKPFAFSEFGPGHHGGAAGMKTDTMDRYDNLTLIRSIREKYPRTIWAAFWHSWANADMAIVDNPNADRLLEDPWVATRDDVDWRQQS